MYCFLMMSKQLKSEVVSMVMCHNFADLNRIDAMRE